MSKEILRVAVIGTGMIANAGHIPAWKNLKEDVKIVAVADILGDRAQLVAETEGVPRAYGDWQKMLDEVKPDIVSVCTPNSYHKEQTIAALEAGAHGSPIGPRRRRRLPTRGNWARCTTPKHTSCAGGASRPGASST